MSITFANLWQGNLFVVSVLSGRAVAHVVTFASFCNLCEAIYHAAYISMPIGGEADENAMAVAHPGYEVKRPFTMLRYVLVGMILEIVNRDPQQLDALTVELWKVLCSWFFRYPHNNLYHSVFYKLVFKTLRCNNVGALRMAVSKGRLVAQLVDSHVDGDKVRSLQVHSLSTQSSIPGKYAVGAADI